MAFNQRCADDILESIDSFPPEKKRIIMRDLEDALPQYTRETLQRTCVSMAKRGMIDATTYTIKEGTFIRNIKLPPRR